MTPSDDGGRAERVEQFCVRFPARDAAVPLSVLDDPELRTSPELTLELLGWAARSAEADVPAELASPVGTYVQSLRDYDGSEDPRADPAVRAAIAEIDAWLVEHCEPADTGPPGSPP